MFLPTAILLLLSKFFCTGEILERDEKLHPGLEFLTIDVIRRSGRSPNCLATFFDNVYYDVFGRTFFQSLQNMPIFIVRISEGEDLLSPNYKTLKCLQAIRRAGCNFNVIFLANGLQLGRMLKFVDRHRELDTRANFLLIHDPRILQPHLHYLWKKMVNVVFIRKFATRPGNPPWYELTTVPFPAPISDILVPRRLDTWRGGDFHANVRLFRDKTENLYSQTLKVTTFQHVPASFKMPAPEPKGDVTIEGSLPIGFSGLEIEVLNTLSLYMNFKTDVYEVPNNEKWGLPTENGSYTGLIGEISSGRADVALGDLHYTPHHLKYMDLTVPYNTQCLTFLTPESRTDNSWMVLILPFRLYLWIGVLISLLLGGLIFFALARFYNSFEDLPIRSNGPVVLYNNFTAPPEGLQQFSRMDNSFLYTFSMILLVSLPRFPKGWSLRVLTGWWWLYCILLVVAYRASMTAILANPAPKVTIDSLEQLADNEITPGGSNDEIKKFFETSVDAAGKKIGSKFEVVTDVDEAVARVSQGLFAFYENIYFLQHASVRRQILAFEAASMGHNSSEREKRNLHIMSNCIINMPISLGLQKNSPLKPRIDRLVRLITEAGLVKKWLNDAMNQVMVADKSADTQVIKALMDLKKFAGAIVALAVGLSLGVAALSAELLYWWLTVFRNPGYDRYSNAIVLSKKVLNK